METVSRPARLLEFALLREQLGHRERVDRLAALVQQLDRPEDDPVALAVEVGLVEADVEDHRVHRRLGDHERAQHRLLGLEVLRGDVGGCGFHLSFGLEGRRRTLLEKTTASAPPPEVIPLNARILRAMKVSRIDTPHGPAEAHVEKVDGAPATLVLGHGAGGGIEAPDLLIARDVAADAGLSVVRVLQPYKVAGRKSAAPTKQLDAAWLAVIAALRDDGPIGDGKLIAGGRSSGARVACRTAAEVGAGRRALPRLPGPPTGQGRRPHEEPPGRAGRGGGPDAGRPGRERPVRHAGVLEAASTTSQWWPATTASRRDQEAIAAAIRAWLPTAVS